MDRYQSTLRRTVKISGIGLHSGREVHLEICPAESNSGIVFQRTDSDNAVPVLVHPHHISNSELSTTIGAGDSRIATIEHLMAAIAGLGIDNAYIKVDAPEIPIMDGSASPFVEKLLQAGIAKQDGFRKLYVIKKAFEVKMGDRVMRIEPARRPTISCKIDFDCSSVIGEQTMDFIFSRNGFLSLCDSRTFCHIRDVEAMRKAGFALGGTLNNAIVVTDDSIMNEDGLRSPDEFVKHKVLDCIGDLAVLGVPLVGNIPYLYPI
jgi:UDP-3-O-[3-hydroxymyristoyl] N-acetylglucosamine deacetylase